MADELDPALEGADEQLDAPVIEEDTDPIAELAAKIGWSPQDQWKGDPDKWKPADEFILAGRDIQSATKDRLRNVEAQLARFGRIAGSLAEEKAAERDTYWREQHAKAVEDGDLPAAEKAAEQIGKVREAAQPGPDPTAAAWVAKNEWFNTDPLATMRAKEISDKLGAAGIPVPEQLTQIDRAIRKEFPELFPAPAKAAPGVQTGQGRPAAASNRVKGFADMPAESQQMARDMNRRNPGVSIESIAKSYWADVANQRKVG